MTHAGFRAAAGQNIHGEADVVEALLAEYGGHTVLDAGCGTGRVAIELDRRGFPVTGVDADPDMLAAARDSPPNWLAARRHRRPRCTGRHGTGGPRTAGRQRDDLPGTGDRGTRGSQPGHPAQPGGLLVPASACNPAG